MEGDDKMVMHGFEAAESPAFSKTQRPPDINKHIVFSKHDFFSVCLYKIFMSTEAMLY